MPESGGLALDAFDAIEELVGRVQDGSVADSDREIHGSHPLVLLIESTLESLSNANLSTAIAGLSSRSQNSLVAERRTLEAAGMREDLQRLLFTFEALTRFLRESSYGSRDDEDHSRFFKVLFPEWLERLHAWALAEDLPGLKDRVAAAQEAYLQVADIIALDS